MSAVVVVRNKLGDTKEVTDFSAWRREVGGGAVGFVIQTPTEVLVDTCKIMTLLPPGRYDAEMVRKARLPKSVMMKEELQGYDAWKCV